MKVKNIVFSGFAAAILMGTAGANAATPFRIASQAYVDKQVSALTGENGAVSQLENLVAGENETLDEGFTSGTVVGAVNELKEDVDTLTGDASTEGSVAHAEASAATAQTAAATAQGEVDALEIKVGDTTDLTGFAQGTDTVVEALNELNSGKADATDLTNLESRVAANETIIKSTGETIPSTIGTTQNVTTIIGAINALKTKTDSMATSDTMTQVTNDIQDLQNALGSGFDSTNTVAAALADKADASTVATDAEVAELLGSGITASSTVTQQLAGKQNALSANELAAIAKLVDGYTSCITTAEALRDPGDTNPAHCVLSASTAGGVEWTPVTAPWVAE